MIFIIEIIWLLLSFGSAYFAYHISHPRPNNNLHATPRVTKLDQIIDLYMKADPKDPSATIDFLMAVDACEDPYEVYRKPPPERVVFYPPLMPSDSSTSARPRRQPKPTPIHHVMDDLARSYQMMYGVPTHHFGSQEDAFYKHLTKMISSGLMSPKEAEDHFYKRAELTAQPQSVIPNTYGRALQTPSGARSYQLQRPGPRPLA